MVSVSLCMIVKDEEAVLERCLSSIYDLADEIIIVDTGSADQTKEIAKAYTEKVYDFEWVHDFSKARNFAFSKATKEYIYSADADEVMDEENRARFRKLKETLLLEVEIVQMMYCNQLAYNTTYNFDEEYRPKLFKRLRNFVWQEPIHEMVRLEPLIYDSDIRIMHLPVAGHSGRDFNVFLRLINKNIPLSKKLHSMYARELFVSGNETDFMESEAYFSAASKDTERSVGEMKEAICVLIKTARLKADIPGLLKYAAKELANEPSAECCFELGEYYFSVKDYEEAAIWYYNAAFETTSILNIQYSGKFPLSRLVDCYNKMGNTEQALQYEKLLNDV